MSDEVVQPPEEPAAPTPNLTLQDLVNISKLIEVSASRGAFRAIEMADVGQLYNKLIDFLVFSNAISKPSTEEIIK